MAEVGNFTINVTYPDVGDIESFGELIGKLVEAKYKKMLEEQSAAEVVNQGSTYRCPADCNHKIQATYLITSQGELVDTKGHSPIDTSGPFKVNGKSVYISNQLIN